MTHIASCSFGKDSIATILLALENNEPLDRVVFCEVMFDHSRNISGEIPEHIEWIYSTAIPKLEVMGVKVDVVKSEYIMKTIRIPQATKKGYIEIQMGGYLTQVTPHRKLAEVGCKREGQSARHSPATAREY